VGRQHDPIIEPGETIDVSILAPSDANVWRGSFVLKRFHRGPLSEWHFKRREIFRKLKIKWLADEEKYTATSETLERSDPRRHDPLGLP
jgi:hypothetical protein